MPSELMVEVFKVVVLACGSFACVLAIAGAVFWLWRFWKEVAGKEKEDVEFAYRDGRLDGIIEGRLMESRESEPMPDAR